MRANHPLVEGAGEGEERLPPGAEEAEEEAAVALYGLAKGMALGVQRSSPGYIWEILCFGIE